MRVIFIDSDGTEHVVTDGLGETAMRCAANRLVPGILGECGGAMACATCHGYVADEWCGKIEPPSTMEKELLAGCIDQRPNSRLTCQIRLTQELDGLRIFVPKSQT